jgi:hypothetical protein
MHICVFTILSNRRPADNHGGRQEALGNLADTIGRTGGAEFAGFAQPAPRKRGSVTETACDQRIGGRREEYLPAAIVPADHVRRPPVLAPHLDDHRFAITFTHAALPHQDPVAWQRPHESPWQRAVW